MKNVKLLGICILLFAALALSACQPAENASTEAILPPSGILSQGHVEPASFVEAAFTIAGRVEAIFVAEGDSVTPGMVLARLSGVEVRSAEIARAEQELLAAQQALAAIQENPSLTQAQAEAAVAEAETALAAAREQLDTLQNPDPALIEQWTARLGLLEVQLDEAQNDLQTLEDQTNPNALRLAQARAEFADLQMSRDLARETLENLQTPDLVQIGQAEARITLLQEQLIQAKSDLETLEDGIDPDRLAAAQARLASAEAGLASSRAALDSLELRAPQGGIVAGISLKVGQFIPAGAAALSIADLSQWVVKTDDLTELEVIDVTLGQSAQITLDALPENPFRAVVTQIQTRFENSRGDVTYTVTLAVEQPAEGIRWGMTGQVLFEKEK